MNVVVVNIVVVVIKRSPMHVVSVVFAIDDSSSMKTNRADTMALEALATVRTAAVVVFVGRRRGGRIRRCASGW